MSTGVTVELVESLETIVQHADSHERGDGVFRAMKKIARAMQRKISKLGGMKMASRAERSEPATSTNRPSISSSLDGYRPEVDVVAPISVRPNAMELLWVCGDCGEHYARQQQCPEQCVACGAPKQNFYAPIED